MGVPGCPELAACTASMESVRIVLMQSISIVVAVVGTEGLVFVALIVAPWLGARNGPPSLGWLGDYCISTRLLYDRLTAQEKNAQPLGWMNLRMKRSGILRG